MKFLRSAAITVSQAVSLRARALFLFALGGILLPTSALAAEGDHVSMQFTKNDQGGLIFALVIGVLAILYGLIIIRRSVLAQSPGDEKMQEVGTAIRQGALAYLRQQIAMMVWFIILLFIGLIGLNYGLGWPLAAGIGGCFVAGVISSYISGYAGMLMAVAGNMRTAAAAITSYGQATKIAFRSGAVAGLVTVGIGLCGASIILLAFPAVAPSLLVGYGFGASLAALFMRVGGGIFTKAADVGADLVGKVEQGIPEDDPRNPATIADNVGDNVGDCAGMAADVFESYEVMLVAAIVLAAATAAVFDPQTWPRLVVFALATAAAGLLACMGAIAFFKGSDDPKADPFDTLNKSFTAAAVGSIALVGLVAFLLLGTNGNLIQTTQLRPVESYERDLGKNLKAIQDRIAKTKNEDPMLVTADEIMGDPAATKLHLIKDIDKGRIGQYIADASSQIPLPDLSGMSPANLDDKANPTLSFATRSVQPPAPGAPPTAGQFQSLADAFKSVMTDGKKVSILKIHQILHLPPTPAKDGMPARAGQDSDVEAWYGPVEETSTRTQIDSINKGSAKQPGVNNVSIEQSVPVQLYTSPDGKVALAVDGSGVDRPDMLRAGGGFPVSYFSADAKSLNDLALKASPTSQPLMPQEKPLSVAIVTHHPVPFYLFWLMVVFGIGMAFAIEYITGHYVSTHKSPTQEVAGVSTAGAAPMIIQGFALALQSSVYSVVAIVIALLVPVLVFNPATYGGYTLSFFGIALVGLGLLTTTAFILAMDTFGPISDNAQGVFEMSGAAEAHPEAAQVVARLDAAGNTTKALTKGFAIATAVVAAVALFHSYLDGAHLSALGLRLDVPEIFLGLLIGGAAPYLFSSFAINAVGRASIELISEVRRQFRNDSGIMAGTSKPDYARCVAIVTSAAQRELLSPGILAIALPIAVGFGFGIGKETTEVAGHSYNLVGAQALGGFLAGAIVSGQLMAVLLANAGGMWDNAKKLVEEGLNGGKGSEAHKAAVIGDTIGDPFKDTAGPALNPLIKVMNLVGLLIAGVVIQDIPMGARVGITVVAIALLILSIYMASKGSMSGMLAAAAEEASIPPPGLPVTGAAPAPVTPTPGKKKLFVEEDETGS